MQQVVDLQDDNTFKSSGIQLLSISPDSVADWKQEGSQLGITLPTLSDAGNRVADEYGVMQWGMASNEPGHTFVLIDKHGKIAWIRDYGSPEHGGLMYVPPDELLAVLPSVPSGS